MQGLMNEQTGLQPLPPAGWDSGLSSKKQEVFASVPPRPVMAGPGKGQGKG